MNQTLLKKSTQKPSSKSIKQKYLTFYLNLTKFGIDILNVREIIGHAKITPLTDMPPYIKGFINLRGTIISVIDLRLRLNLPTSDDQAFNAIIIVERIHNDQTTPVGLYVDTVANVITIDSPKIMKINYPHESLVNDYLLGVVDTDEYETLLLDTPKLLQSDNFSLPSSFDLGN